MEPLFPRCYQYSSRLRDTLLVYQGLTGVIDARAKVETSLHRTSTRGGAVDGWGVNRSHYTPTGSVGEWASRARELAAFMIGMPSSFPGVANEPWIWWHGRHPSARASVVMIQESWYHGE